MSLKILAFLVIVAAFLYICNRDEKPIIMFPVIEHLEGEEWRALHSFEHYYVSSLGRVASVRNNTARLLRLTRQTYRNRTYAYVCLMESGKRRKVRVHRLVAEVFLSNPHNFKEIDHINNDGTDNRISNLRWCTHKENMNNPITAEIQKRYRTFDPDRPDAKKWINRHEGERKRVGQFLDGILIKEFSSIGEAERVGFVKCSISAVCHGRNKTYRGYVWKFLD